MSKRRVPDILIEQYVLGELPEEQAREVEQSEGFAARVAAIEQDNAQFAERYPAQAYVPRIRNRSEAQTDPAPSRGRSRTGSRGRTVRYFAIAMPGAAAIVAFALIVFGGIGVETDPAVSADQEIVRLKGARPQISVFRASGTGTGEAEQLEDGALARAGDRIQIAYNAGDAPYGMIVSIDGRGATTLHYPLTASAEPVLEPGGSEQLPYAYQLDDAPAFERFYFITSGETFSVSDVLESVRAQASRIAAGEQETIQLSGAFDTYSVTIRKGE